MGKKLSNAPVYYTIVQVQFNPIMELDQYINRIQSRMSENGFPDFKRQIIQQFVLPMGNIQPDQITTSGLTPSYRFLFGDMVGSSMFMLANNSLSFQTTSYESFDKFALCFMEAIAIIQATLPVKFIERIGIRYLDAIQPKNEGETLGDFLIPQVMGLSTRDNLTLNQSFSETISITPKDQQVISRVIIRNGDIGLPLDLNDSAPKIAPRFATINGLHAIIDIDASVMHRDLFDLLEIKGHVGSLHSEIEEAFTAIVSPYALDAWA